MFIQVFLSRVESCHLDLRYATAFREAGKTVVVGEGVLNIEEVKGRGALPRTATEWARTVICVTAPFDLAPLPEQCLCQRQTIPESAKNASFLAETINYNVH
jgi:hypothetical protein